MKDSVLNYIPVLSDSIEFNRLSENEYILCNLRDKHYLKINLDVYNILLLINGSRDLYTISRIYKEKYEKSVSIGELSRLLQNKLSVYGVLKGYEEQIKPSIKPSYLKFSFIIINERLVSKIAKFFYFLFKKEVALSLIIIGVLFSLFTFISNVDIYKKFDIHQSLAYFFLLMFCSVTFHEIGHATAASFYGAKHGGIGGGFYLFKPVYYADVTDIWRLSRMQRVIVNLSGVYFELIFCSFVLCVGIVLNNYVLTSTILIVLIVKV